MSKMNIGIESTWQGGFKGKGRIEGQRFNVEIAAPVSFGGSGEGANPKELLASATNACFLTTLRAITENKRLPLDSIVINTAADTDEDYFSITHTVNLQLSKGATEKDVQAAERMIESADKTCAVGNLVKKAGVTIEIVPAVKRSALSA